MNEEPDYKNYDIAELESTYSYIDKEAYPERAKKLREEIESRLKVGKESIAKKLTEDSLIDEYQAPVGNWFKLHWQGMLPLDLSYWVNVFAIGLLLLFISPVLFQNLTDSNASPALRGGIIITFYVLITGISVWQLTGLYRYQTLQDRYKKHI